MRRRVDAIDHNYFRSNNEAGLDNDIVAEGFVDEHDHGEIPPESSLNWDNDAEDILDIDESPSLLGKEDMEYIHSLGAKLRNGSEWSHADILRPVSFHCS